MNEPHDPNLTADISSIPADSLDAGLAAGFGRPASVPRSSLGDLRPVLLREAEGESSHVVKPNSDAMPLKSETGDRYQLSGEIARGGMGAVLRGRDVDLGRDLAVKILLEKYADRPEVARRFIEEAQIGGQLQHPGVVPVYDIGRFGNRPFFTMKLVKGRTLAAILGVRTNPADDRPRLLNIALQVAQTLAYAHAKGVIHRDLKPANIMVGAFGEVQLMDWGLAKVLSEGGIADEEQASRQYQQPEDVTTIRTARSTGSAGSFGSDTEAGSLLGTPAYMPPEQANGDIANLDRRADVFGLGAILCEILTGKAPYVGRSHEEVRRKAANGDLADAHSRLASCGADAELIALARTCLSAEAVDRPKDAQAVVDALTAYLDGVQARLHMAELAEAAARAKAMEEAKRRRLSLTLAASVLVLVGVVGAGLWVADRQAGERRREREIAELKSRQGLESALDQAEAALRADKLPDADAALAQAGTRADDAPPDLRDRLTGLKADRAMVAELERIFNIRFSGEGTNNAVSRGRAKGAYSPAFAQIGIEVGDVAAATEAVRRSPVRDRLLEALDTWLQLDPAHSGLLDVLIAADPDEFRTLFRRAIAANDLAKLSELCRQVDGAKLPPRFAAVVSLILTVPVKDRYRILQGAWERSPTDFIVNFQLGYLLAQSALRRYPDALAYSRAAVALNPNNQPAWAILSFSLAIVGDRDEAIAAAHKSVELMPNAATSHWVLGNALYRKGQVEEAIACHRKAIVLDADDAIAHSNLGAILCDAKQDYDGAIACFTKAIELDPKDANGHYNLGNALKGKGQLDEAIASYKKAIEIDQKLAMVHSNLAHALYRKGQVEEAIACFRKAIELDSENASAHINLGAILCNAKQDYDGAIACFRRAIKLDPKNAMIHNNLGNALKGLGQLDEAIASYKKAIALDPKYAAAHDNLGHALYRKGQAEEAIACYQEAIALDPKLANAHYNLGIALHRKGQLDEAIASYKKAIKINQKIAGVHFNLGTALHGKGQLDEAIASYKKAIEVEPNHPVARTQLARTEGLAAARDKLPAFQNGSYTPATTDERLALADWCQIKKLHRTGVGLYAAAFAADAKVADNLNAQHRFNAACFAALAAAGQGEDAAKLDDNERSRLRKQSLDWLRADLAAYAKLRESGPPAARAFVQQRMQHWQQDTDLTSIRDKEALTKLSAEEQKTFTQLWADVAALLKQVQEKAKS